MTTNLVHRKALFTGTTDGSNCDSLPAKAAGVLGGLDIVVNNAGVIRRGAITEATDEDYAVSFAVNVDAPFRICRAAIPLLTEQGGGVIINVASCWGLRPGPNHPIYCMSKASMTQCLDHNHAHQGVRINTVCPLEVDTPMLRSEFTARGLDPQRAIDDLNQSIPLGHIAIPAEIADVVLFLASNQSLYVRRVGRGFRRKTGSVMATNNKVALVTGGSSGLESNVVC